MNVQKVKKEVAESSREARVARGRQDHAGPSGVKVIVFAAIVVREGDRAGFALITPVSRRLGRRASTSLGNGADHRERRDLGIRRQDLGV